MARPLMLGKTTLARGVVRRLGRQGVTPICLDDYHRFSRAERAARSITALDPQANDMTLMADHLAILRSGGTIRKPVYDHRSGTLREPELVAATSLVIAYGLLTLTPPIERDLFDLTIYLEPTEALQQEWRMLRDTSQRGYTPQDVQRMQLANNGDARRYVFIQRPLADMVVRYHPAHSGKGIDILLFLRKPLPSIDFALLPGGAVQLLRGLRDDDGLPVDCLKIPANAPATELNALCEQLHQQNQARFPALANPEPRPTDHGPAMALVHELVVSYLLHAVA
jgi:phosphoribulokinase